MSTKGKSMIACYVSVALTKSGFKTIFIPHSAKMTEKLIFIDRQGDGSKKVIQVANLCKMTTVLNIDITSQVEFHTWCLEKDVESMKEKLRTKVLETFVSERAKFEVLNNYCTLELCKPLKNKK